MSLLTSQRKGTSVSAMTEIATHLLPAEAALVNAIGDRPYLLPTPDGKVTYRAAFDARTFIAQVHMWLPEYEIEVDGRKVGARKTAKGALALLVRLADADYRARVAEHVAAFKARHC